jgi:hypothetical protein
MEYFQTQCLAVLLQLGYGKWQFSRLLRQQAIDLKTTYQTAILKQIKTY